MGFCRRLCGMGGKWCNHILFLLLLAVLGFQVFQFRQNGDRRPQRRSMPESASINRRYSDDDDDYNEDYRAYEEQDTDQDIDEILSQRDSKCIGRPKDTCPYYHKDLAGREIIDTARVISPEESIRNSGECLATGGCYTPPDCLPRQRVAVLIPYKDREEHLFTLLNYLHPILQRQHIQYCIFVIEQVDNGRFNKGLIMNAGFKEILKTGQWDCIVFHDVDMIPEDDHNLYLCQNQPTHLSPLIDKFGYKLHYGTEYGGVTMMQPKQYVDVNGYSNMFWGWGREDSDMEFRLSRKGYAPVKPINVDAGRYSMIPHMHPWRFQNEKNSLGAATKLTTKEKLMLTKHERASWDGVKNVQYTTTGIDHEPTFTKVRVDIRRFLTKTIEVRVGPPTDAQVLRLEPDEGGECRYVDYGGEYLDSQYTRVLSKEQRHAFTLEEAQAHCSAIGQACAGFVKEYSTVAGRDYVLREKAVLVSPETDAKVMHSRVERVATLKFCPGEMAQNFAVDKPVSEAIYSAKLELHFVIPLSVSLVYRDTVIYEGVETGIEHEWAVPIHANATRENLSYTFETEQFSLPSHPGWYTVNAKISDRFDQTWTEWSFQFKVEEENCKKCSGSRAEYIVELKDNIEKFREKIKHDGKWQRDEKRKLAYLFSFESDPDDERAPSFKTFMSQRSQH